MNNYIKFRVIERNGLFFIQGLKVLYPKLKRATWFFKDFWRKETYYLEDIELEYSWVDMELISRKTESGGYCGYSVNKTYTSKKAAFAVLDNFIKDSVIEPVKEIVSNEIKVVSRD